MRSALPPLLLCCAATAQQQVAACADLQQQTAAINEQCCGSDDAACSSGVPTSCDVGCASVFLPFLRDCPDVALPFASVVALCEATVAKAGAAGGGRRRVNWFTNGAAWPVGVDGLDLAGWVGAHRDAITGVFPCCGSWSALPDGTFISNMGSTAAISRLGLTVIPTGHFSVEWVMSEAWMRPGSLTSALALVEKNGWDGLAIDNEDYPPEMPAEMPAAFGRLLGNLSKAFAAAGKTVVVDVASDWEGCIGGPEHLRSYAQLAPEALRFMDMGSYCKKWDTFSMCCCLSR